MKTDDLSAVIGAVQKHLPGAHDQKGHAGDIGNRIEGEKASQEEVASEFNDQFGIRKELALLSKADDATLYAQRLLGEFLPRPAALYRPRGADQNHTQFLVTRDGRMGMLATYRSGRALSMRLGFKNEADWLKVQRELSDRHLINDGSYESEMRARRLDMSQTIGDVFEKHQAGKHDQQTHAGTDSGDKWTEEEIWDSDPPNDPGEAMAVAERLVESPQGYRGDSADAPDVVDWRGLKVSTAKFLQAHGVSEMDADDLADSFLDTLDADPYGETHYRVIGPMFIKDYGTGLSKVLKDR